MQFTHAVRTEVGLDSSCFMIACLVFSVIMFSALRFAVVLSIELKPQLPVDPPERTLETWRCVLYAHILYVGRSSTILCMSYRCNIAPLNGQPKKYAQNAMFSGAAIAVHAAWRVRRAERHAVQAAAAMARTKDARAMKAEQEGHGAHTTVLGVHDS